MQKEGQNSPRLHTLHLVPTQTFAWDRSAELWELWWVAGAELELADGSRLPWPAVLLLTELLLVLRRRMLTPSSWWCPPFRMSLLVGLSPTLTPRVMISSASFMLSHLKHVVLLIYAAAFFLYFLWEISLLFYPSPSFSLTIGPPTFPSTANLAWKREAARSLVKYWPKEGKTKLRNWSNLAKSIGSDDDGNELNKKKKKKLEKKVPLDGCPWWFPVLVVESTGIIKVVSHEALLVVYEHWLSGRFAWRSTQIFEQNRWQIFVESTLIEYLLLKHWNVRTFKFIWKKKNLRLIWKL